MARQLADQTMSFSFGDLAIAGAMSKRAVQHVVEAGLLPDGKGTRVLKRIAVIGGFVGVGVPLLAAGRIARAILDEFNQPDGEVPIGLSEYWRRLPSDAREELLKNAHDDYFVHKVFFEYDENYHLGEALRADALFEIVDKQFLFLMRDKIIKTADQFGEDDLDSGFVGRIDGWARGGEATVIPAATMFNIRTDDPRFKELWLENSSIVQRARSNAVGKLTVNVSLAIRNGFDRLAEFHAQKRKKRKPAKGDLVTS